jgi:hypothetical protein
VIAALLLNAVLLLAVVQMILPADPTLNLRAPDVHAAQTRIWAPLLLFGSLIVSDIALYATLFTRRDPVDLWFDERGVSVRSGAEVVLEVAAADIRAARWRRTHGGWAVLEVDVVEGRGAGPIRLADIAIAGGRGREGGREPWTSVQLDALVALIDVLAQQAAGRRGSEQDIPAPLRVVRERAGTATGR